MIRVFSSIFDNLKDVRKFLLVNIGEAINIQNIWIRFLQIYLVRCIKLIAL